jgi:hypothetical protein
MKPGFYDMSALEYHADPCDVPSLTQSIANEALLRSPWHAHRLHPKLGGKSRAATDAKDAGALAHALLLGQEHAFAVIAAEDFRTKAARELRDDAIARGKTPVKKSEFDAAMEHAARIDNTLRREHGIELGRMKRELTAVWHEQTDIRGQVPVPVACRARLDAFDGTTIYDVKTCADASYGKLQRSVIQFGYHVQAAAYMSAVEHLMPAMAGRVRFVLLFVENETSAIVPVALDGMFHELGQERWQTAVNVWQACLASGVWPGYAHDGPLRLECPEWAKLSSDCEVRTLRGKVES